MAWAFLRPQASSDVVRRRPRVLSLDDLESPVHRCPIRVSEFHPKQGGCARRSTAVDTRPRSPAAPLPGRSPASRPRAIAGFDSSLERVTPQDCRVVEPFDDDSSGPSAGDDANFPVSWSFDCRYMSAARESDREAAIR